MVASIEMVALTADRPSSGNIAMISFFFMLGNLSLIRIRFSAKANFYRCDLIVGPELNQKSDVRF